MDDPILVDTDILVDFLRGHTGSVDFVTAHQDRIMLSAIVVAELYAGVRGDREKEALDRFIAMFRVIPVDTEIARLGGLFKQRYGKSHGIGLADAVIAATSETENAALKTLNRKHYPMFKGLKAAYKK